MIILIDDADNDVIITVNAVDSIYFLLLQIDLRW